MKLLISSVIRLFSRDFSKMSDSKKQLMLENCRKIVPKLTDKMHKGQSGRIGIIGGSLEYTGAPYYAGIAALKTGCDLVHIICPQSAALPIKSYSPELIVHPLLDSDNAIELIEPWLDRLHVILIGNGLGRDEKIMETVSKLIVSCRKKEKPLVFDADGLFIITQNPDLIRDYKHTILTPNAMELSRLIGDSGDKMNLLIEKLGRNCVILEKSDKDRIYDTKSREIVECSKGGSNRRSGGQGDLLAGSLATFFHWSLNLIDKNVYKNDENPAILSCYAASYLIKYCNKLSYDEHGRSMTAFDMIGKISHAFKEHFENE